MSAKKRSPQEKKRLSLARDRRDDYGENDKARRKSIPRRRAKKSRSYRHATRQVLRVQDAEQANERVRTVRRGEWVKVPDTPLQNSIERKEVNRARLKGRKAKRPR
jgi:hypothetical protein